MAFIGQYKQNNIELDLKMLWDPQIGKHIINVLAIINVFLINVFTILDPLIFQIINIFFKRCSRM